MSSEEKSPGQAACEAFWEYMNTGPDGQPASAAWDWAGSQGAQGAWMAASQAAAEDLRAALRSITSRITTSAMDFSDYEPNAWVYGIAVGWDCDEDHDHDDICGGTAAMKELTARFGWDEDAVGRLRGYRRAYAAATKEGA